MARRISILLAAALVLAACTGAEPGVDVEESEETVGQGDAPPAPSSGDPLPEIEVTDFDDEPAVLTDFTGTPLVVNFWASWCPPCIAEMPDLEAVHRLADGRVTFVGINTQDSPEQAAEMIEQTGVTYDLLRDPDAELFQALGVFAMPTTFYVDAGGGVVGRHTGLLTRDTLIDDLNEHLGVDVSSDR